MTTSTAQVTKAAVTLKGSAQMVTEFFNYGIHSILYQRGVYPAGENPLGVTIQIRCLDFH